MTSKCLIRAVILIPAGSLLDVSFGTETPPGTDEVVFDFDASRDLVNPSFQAGGLTAAFATDGSVHPDGQARFTTGRGAVPYSGSGHMLLTVPSGATGERVAVLLSFSNALGSITIQAMQAAGGKLPFNLEFYS